MVRFENSTAIYQLCEFFVCLIFINDRQTANPLEQIKVVTPQDYYEKYVKDFLQISHCPQVE